MRPVCIVLSSGVKDRASRGRPDAHSAICSVGNVVESCLFDIWLRLATPYTGARSILITLITALCEQGRHA
jgi:hypothetical protein